MTGHEHVFRQYEGPDAKSFVVCECGYRYEFHDPTLRVWTVWSSGPGATANTSYTHTTVAGR